MPKLIVKNVDSRIDGEYDCQVDDLTNRELHTIRQMCGIAPTGIVGGLLSEDAGLVVALAAIVLQRQGKVVDVDSLWDAEHGAIVFDFTPDGADEVPPEQPPSGGNDGEKNDESGSGSKSSGRRSRKSSASPDRDQKDSGSPD